MIREQCKAFHGLFLQWYNNTVDIAGTRRHASRLVRVEMKWKKYWETVLAVWAHIQSQTTSTWTQKSLNKILENWTLGVATQLRDLSLSYLKPPVSFNNQHCHGWESHTSRPSLTVSSHVMRPSSPLSEAERREPGCKGSNWQLPLLGLRIVRMRTINEARLRADIGIKK